MQCPSPCPRRGPRPANCSGQWLPGRHCAGASRAERPGQSAFGRPRRDVLSGSEVPAGWLGNWPAAADVYDDPVRITDLIFEVELVRTGVWLHYHLSLCRPHAVEALGWVGVDKSDMMNSDVTGIRNAHRLGTNIRMVIK